MSRQRWAADLEDLRPVSAQITARLLLSLSLGLNAAGLIYGQPEWNRRGTVLLIAYAAFVWMFRTDQQRTGRTPDG